MLRPLAALLLLSSAALADAAEIGVEVFALPEVALHGELLGNRQEDGALGRPAVEVLRSGARRLRLDGTLCGERARRL